jgi:sulfofructose kinase
MVDCGPAPILPDGSPRILFCGATSLDSIFRVEVLPDGPGKALSQQMAVVAQGMAASAAAAASRLGARAMLFSRQGDDDTGQRIYDELSAVGIDCTGVRRFPDVASSLCTVIVDNVGERLMVPFYDPTLPSDPGWLSLDLVESADAVLVDVRWPQGATAMLDSARSAGIPAVLDADIGPREVLLELASRATHAIFSQPGARIAAGKDDDAEVLTWLTDRLDGFVAVTLGAHGCHWLEAGEICHAIGYQINAVDTLAAGDVFHGAFTWALAQGVALPECIAIANAAAAIKCQTFGGRLGAPDRKELLNFMNGTTR